MHFSPLYFKMLPLALAASVCTLTAQPKQSIQIKSGNLGAWQKDDLGLPVFLFTKPLPVYTYGPDKKKVSYPTDPIFILGNKRFVSFVRASGQYSILTTDRTMGLLNSDGSRIGSEVYSTITLTRAQKDYNLLVTHDSLSKLQVKSREFGCGYARFEYKSPEQLQIKRTVSTAPSTTLSDGPSALIVTLELTNQSKSNQYLRIKEGLACKYKMLFDNNLAHNANPTTYSVKPEKVRENLGMVRFEVRNKWSWSATKTSEPGWSEGYTPYMALQIIEGSSGSIKIDSADSTKAALYAQFDDELAPGETKVYQVVVGFAYNHPEWEKQTFKLMEGPDFTFRREWRSILVDFPKETDPMMRMEMQWHQYALHAMSTYSSVYKESYIPQGQNYEFELGVSAAMNDLAMHSLPFSILKPSEAKSILRYIAKHTTYRGEIIASDEGARRIPEGGHKKSHLQLYFFQALVQYLESTKDHTLWTEKVTLCEPAMGYETSFLDAVARMFVYLRDEIYVGPHGHIRLMASDWNDCFYQYFPSQGYYLLFRSESVANTALAALYVSKLAIVLKSAADSDPKSDPRIMELHRACKDFGSAMTAKVEEELRVSDFLPRAYIQNKVFGKDSLFLEPQVYALGLPGLSIQKKKILWNALYDRVGKNEAKGLRQAEKPLGGFENGGRGSRENGGFWYALHGPAVIHLSELDSTQAWKELEKMTFAHQARQYPDYWVGMWSGADSFDSSLLPSQGMVNPYVHSMPVFCAHAHAWPLYVYLKLKKYSISNKSSKP